MIKVLLPTVPLGYAQEHVDSIASVRISKDSKEKCILIIDDEISITRFLGEFLAMYGFKYETFTDPEAALQWFEDNSDMVDLVITDQTMPKLTGLEISKTIHEKRASIPVLLCSGFSELISEESLREAGVSAFFAKPINSRKLLQTVDSLLFQGRDGRG